MSNPFESNNPGLGGLKELTTVETEFIQNLTSLSYALGDILYYDGNNLVRLPIGSSTNVLTVSGGIPAWTATASGNVTKVGTPVNNQVGVWTGDGTIEGDVDFTFDTATNTLGVGLIGLDGRVQVHAVKSDASDGLLIETADGTDVGLLGVANTANATWYGAHNFSAATQDTIAAFTGAGKTLGSLATATYPSLTELSYVKGVTSAIQTQFTGKQSTITFGTGVQTALGVNIGSAGAPVLFNGAGGTPSSLTGTNITGTASGLTAGNVTTNANLTGHVTSVGNAAVLGSFTKAQLNTAVSDGDVVYLDSVDTITGAKTMSGLNAILVSSSGLTVRNPANTFSYTITGAAIAAARTLNLPLTTGTDTLACLGIAQTFTGVQTFTSPATTTSITTASTSFTAWAGATTLLTIGGTGASASMFAPSTLDTTSSTTGAIRTSGGISAAKAANFGTTVTVGTTMELGHATDTTFARAAAGIYSVEGMVLNGYATTATAAGTTALTIASAQTQFFTGTSTQTVTLATTSVVVGQTYRIVNNSTGIVTVQSSGANTIQILGAGMSAIFTATTATPTTAAHWSHVLTPFTSQNIAQTASANAATVNIAHVTNTITNNSAATITITLPTAGAIDGEMRVVKVLDFSAVAQTITWVNTQNSTVSAPVTSNGSTTLPITAGFQYNSASSLWRCIASA